MFLIRGRGGSPGGAATGDDEGLGRELTSTPLPLHLYPGSSLVGRGADESQLDVLVAGAGDARANGVYRRCGTQNDAPRGARAPRKKKIRARARARGGEAFVGVWGRVDPFESNAPP